MYMYMYIRILISIIAYTCTNITHTTGRGAAAD